jgi:transposase-like protein
MKRYSNEDKTWLVQEWEKSGRSKWAFARELGLNYQTFSTWTRRPEDGQGFVEIGRKLEEGGAERGERTGCALVVEPGCIRVHLPAGIRPRDLAVVVQALR